MISRFGFLWCMLLSSIWAKGQHNPIISHYSTSEYKAHHQNWSVIEDNEGKVYAANTEGLLTGDGNQWSLHSLKSHKIIRSVCYHKGNIYTGSHGGIGYWQKDPCGFLTYHDLTSQIKVADVQNEEIWNIVSSGDSLWFQSFSILLVYDGTTFSKVNFPGTIMFLQLANNKKYIQSLQYGIFEILPDLSTKYLKGSEFFNDKTVTGILPLKNSNAFLISTNAHGVFVLDDDKINVWNRPFQKQFISSQINKIWATKKKQIILGSINSGVFIFHESGQLDYHLNVNNGLQNNTVLSIFENQSGDIWLGLDKGLAKIHLSSSDRQFHDISGVYGSVYSVHKHDHIIYLGTNQGVYYYDKTKNSEVPKFVLLQGSQGQSWQLFEAEGHLYCGHNEGTFLIEGKKIKKISGVTGGWYNIEVPESKGNLWVQGNYTGLLIFKLMEGKLQLSHKIEGYTYPVKKCMFKNGFLWVNGPNRGLVRLTLDRHLKHVIDQKQYGKMKGLEDANNLDLYEFNTKMMVNDGEQHFEYDEKSDHFFVHPLMSTFEPGFIVRAINKNDWVRVYRDHIILMEGEKVTRFHEITLTKDYHNVTLLDTNQVVYCKDDGYFLESLSSHQKLKSTTPIPINITLSFDNHTCQTNTFNEIPGNHYTLTAQFYDNVYDKDKKYLFRLLPIQKDWKMTHSLSAVHLSKLPPGVYTLEIKRNDQTVGYKLFKVLAPWYSNTIAKIGYILLALGIGFWTKKYYDGQLQKAKNQHESEQKRLIKEHQLDIENQRLLHENKIKNKELASSAMQLVQKNEILQEIKNELIDIRKSSHHTLTTKDFQIMMKQINTNLTQEENKKLFDNSFEEMHDSFIQNLKKQYPLLTKDDMKLATYIRMDLSTKEIAPLFNISLRGLENKRYRLRKKLHLDVDVNLLQFFQKIDEK
ncbi:MAG: hypothetical protein WAT79_06510 [Saprospiraceae bacterium]